MTDITVLIYNGHCLLTSRAFPVTCSAPSFAGEDIALTWHDELPVPRPWMHSLASWCAPFCDRKVLWKQKTKNQK